MVSYARIEKGGIRMTVKELIERLKTADPEAEVLINTYDDTLDIVGVITHYEDEPVIIETVED